MANANFKVRTVAIPNVTIAACKLRRPYNGKFGLQYGAHLSGEGLAEIGLKQANDGGFWYSTNAKYGAMDVNVHLCLFGTQRVMISRMIWRMVPLLIYCLSFVTILQVSGKMVLLLKLVLTPVLPLFVLLASTLNSPSKTHLLQLFSSWTSRLSLLRLLTHRSKRSMVRTASTGCVPLVSPLRVVFPARRDRPLFYCGNTDCLSDMYGAEVVAKTCGWSSYSGDHPLFYSLNRHTHGHNCPCFLVSTDTPMGPHGSHKQPRIA